MGKRVYVRKQMLVGNRVFGLTLLHGPLCVGENVKRLTSTEILRGLNGKGGAERNQNNVFRVPKGERKGQKHGLEYEGSERSAPSRPNR